VPSRKVVGDAFVPYVSRGRWALDMQGNWVWQSDYPFGWVVFHHGRWVDVPGIGWAWIPGYLYSPAWVVWGSPAATIAYVGWAPMGPSFIWVDGVAVVAGGEWSPYWVFCRSHYAFSPRVHLHVVKSERRHEYLSRRTVPREAPRPTYRWYAPFGRGSDRGASSGDTGSPEVTGAGGAGGAGRTAGATAASRRELSERVERRARAPRALDSPGAARVGSVPGAANRTPPKPRVRVDEGLHVERKVGDAPRALRQSPSARSSGPGRRAVPPRARLQAKPAKLRPKRTLQPVPARPKRTLEPAPARPKKGE
jgi:hypothetical protein